MTKTQFLAQLAVSPVIHAPEKDISNNVDTITAGTETRNGKRLHSDSLVARLRSRLKPCLLASKTKPSKELVEEPESTPVSAKRPRFVNDFTPRKTSESVQVGTEKSKMIKGNFHPGKTTIKQIPVNAKKLRFVNVTPRCTSESLHSSKKSISVDDNPCSNKTTDEQVPISAEDHGLAKNFVNHEHKNNQSTSVIPRSRLTQDGTSPKKICEEIPAYPRKCRLSKETVGFVNNISESMHGRKHRLIQEGTNHKKTKSVTNAKRVSKAAKIKTLAKIENSNQPKSKKRADASQSAKNNPSSDAQKKAKVKAIWNPPRLTASTIPLTRGRSSSLTPSKRGTRSQDQAQTPTTPQLRSQSTTPRLVITLNRAPPNPPNRSQTVGPSSKGHRSSSCTGVYPPSVSLHPIPVRAPPIISPLQPLSVIGRRLLKNQCGECGRVLSSPAALESHVQLHTGRRPFSCTLCGKCFPDSKGLSRHGRVHRNGRIHICSQCGKGFVYRFGLTKHLQMVHGRVKPFACQVCSKGFFTKRDLEAHFRIHTGEKPFHCNLCEKQFKRRVELNVHLRWHNGEKRHWCPYCGKGFLDYNNLKRHKYIHTGEKPHSCSHCSKKFTQSGHLKKHLKNVHKVK
ncbi:zinc finger protein 37 homolog [Lampris incognitus]|uniref:zinc finger protein 37 homolog n=1 Tax=Lampris incognitus TaxID=2546036 RepID=UPI0024B50689|nr:zinc finger protein 37 homolog [Lampris incognitus]